MDLHDLSSDRGSDSIVKIREPNTPNPQNPSASAPDNAPLEAAQQPDVPVKRGRGRPRKIKPPKFDWVAWSSSED